MFSIKGSSALAEAVLLSSIKELDEEFVDSSICEYWCDLGGFSYREFKEKFKQYMKDGNLQHADVRGRLISKLPPIQELRDIAKDKTLGQLCKMFHVSAQNLNYYLHKYNIEYIKANQNYRQYMYKGVRYTLTKLCSRYGINKTTFLERLSRGYSVKEAVELPIQTKFHK